MVSKRRMISKQTVDADVSQLQDKEAELSSPSPASATSLFPAAVMFEGGVNQWRHFDQWPPTASAVRRQRLCLRTGGSLSFSPALLVPSSSVSVAIGDDTGACTINRICAQQYVGKYQSCMVISGRLIVHAPVRIGCCCCLSGFSSGIPGSSCTGACPINRPLITMHD